MTPLIAFAAALIVSVLGFPAAIGQLARARMGQQIRQEGPVAHHGKAGTPTAGGVVFLLVAIVLYLVVDRSLAGLFVLIALILGGTLGFIDDFSAIRGGRNLGLRARQKIVIQLATGALLGYLALRWGLTSQLVPFDGRHAIGGLIIILVSAHQRPARLAAASLVTLVAMAELLWWNAASRLNAESRAVYAVLEAPTGAEAAAIGLLETTIAADHRRGDHPRVEVVGLGGAWQNLAMVRGWEATNGYNPLRIGFYDRLVAPGEENWNAAQRRFPPSFGSYDSALARALGLTISPTLLAQADEVIE